MFKDMTDEQLQNILKADRQSDYMVKGFFTFSVIACAIIWFVL